MDKEDKDKIELAVSQSGFPLEHYIGNVLRKKGWRIITNRYYIDDLKNIEREIDILAYKIHTDEEEKIKYYTCLIISCKKSDKYTWCFLTRDADIQDNNIDWTPLHFCSADIVLKYMTEKRRNLIIDKYKEHSGIKHLYEFSETVFAYQQLAIAESNKSGRKPGDYYIDKNEDIHNSIITCIKALEAEKHSRINKAHEKYKRFYTFHLVSVFDGKMVKDYFNEEGKQHIEEIHEIKYLNRHIVNKEEDFYIVNFVTKDKFEYRLNLWDYFHSYNSKYLLGYVISEYYKDVFKDEEKANVLWDTFKSQVLWILEHCLRYKCNIEKDYKIDLYYRYKNKKLELYTNYYLEESDIDTLNNDQDLLNYFKRELLEIYRYEGEFSFSNDELPF